MSNQYSSNHHSFQITNEISAISCASETVAEFGKHHQLSETAINHGNLVLEELVLNIISYAYDDKHEHLININLSVQEKKLLMIIEDDGRDFNPAAFQDVPTRQISLDDIEYINIGLRLVKMLSDSISYKRVDGRNIVTVVIEDRPGKKTLTSIQQEERILAPPKEFKQRASIKSLEEYRQIYQRSIEQRETFWAEQAEDLHWIRKWDTVLEEDFLEGHHQWFLGGKLNVTYNCLDRHLQTWRKN